MQLEVPLPSQVLELFAAPRHAGRPGAGRYRYGVGGAVSRGSLIGLWLACAGGCIREARFEAFGCPATIACAEWLCRRLQGAEIPAAERLQGLAVAEALKLPAAKRAVALVAEDALKAALAAAEQELDPGSEV